MAWLLRIVPGFAGNSAFNRFKERVTEENEFVMCISSVAFTVEAFWKVLQVVSLEMFIKY